MTVVSDPAKALALAQELSVLLAKGAIEPVDPLLHPGGFCSAYFLVSKKVSGFRPVLDLRGINRFLKVLPFHMLTTADTLCVVTQGEWFATADLRDAYFHVPIARLAGLRASSGPGYGAPLNSCSPVGPNGPSTLQRRQRRQRRKLQSAHSLSMG
ncbi:hypothetical protein CesoFtcFv8_019901 [Champsocephalus esox]|uniref:Reverse transcriptase domain-containing protein n=1 Tax=Champsocephalus esox TaxID=159716 RepID=A0AAN8BF09_9TELE|nr:hypothetical protein CesoFtcFv8_019901 [Champsocephalus esox]